MKKIFVILMLLFCTPAFAANYYVKNGGNDGLDGLSDANAWATINKVSTSSFSAGDNIYFKRGSVWQNQTNILSMGNSGTVGSPITLDAYGTGAKPVITASLSSTSTGDWADRGGNVWRYTSAYFSAYDCGNIVFGSIGSETGTGTKMKNVTLTAQGQFKWVSGYVELYSVGNPVTVYTTVNLCLTLNGLSLIGAAYDTRVENVVVQNLDVRYAGANGIMIKNAKGITIQNCDVSYIGGGDQAKNYTTQYGEGIEVNDYGEDITITGNTVNQIFEGGISVQSSAATTVHKNINITNNTITNVGATFAYSNIHASSVTNGVFFENNTGSGIGNEFMRTSTWSSTAWGHFLCFQIAGTVTDKVYVRNNTFTGGADITNPLVSEAYAGANWLFYYTANDITDTVVDYNNYVHPMMSAQFAYTHNNTTKYTISDWNTWKSVSGQDAHSTMITGLHL